MMKKVRKKYIYNEINIHLTSNGPGELNSSATLNHIVGLLYYMYARRLLQRLTKK